MPRTSDVKDTIRCLLSEQDSVATREVARASGVSRQAAHRHLKELVEQGRLIRRGAGRSVRYHPTSRQLRGWQRAYRLEGLEEIRVWEEASETASVLFSIAPEARVILEYAVTELVNNAIDHSGGDEVEVSFEATDGRVAVEVVDDGVGIFERLVEGLELEDPFAAIQELAKGKVTTDPEHHTGEGIFFTSRSVDLFEIDSGGLRWTVDNERDDVALGTATDRAGTRVRCEIDRQSDRRLRDVFDRYTTDYRFDRTRIVVELFEIGVRFISRSEAKRLLRGLEKFFEVVLDFEGVEQIGQGFADEVFRVWARAHPDTRLVPVRMNPAVEFMVKRGRGPSRG